MLVQKDGFATRIEKEKNLNGELVETGKYVITFKVYDRPFIELVLQNGGTEIGSPITVVIENKIAYLSLMIMKMVNLFQFHLRVLK